MAASFSRKCTISGDVTQHDAKMNVKQESATAVLQTKTSLTRRHVDTTIRRALMHQLVIIRVLLQITQPVSLSIKFDTIEHCKMYSRTNHKSPNEV